MAGGASLIASCGPDQPLLKRAQWEMVLRETGFAETDSLPGLIGPTGGEGQIGLLARKSYEQISAPDGRPDKCAGRKIMGRFLGRLRSG